MLSLQEYQHVHLLWFKKRSFTALVMTRRVKAQWARAAPALHTRRFCSAYACSVKPGSTEALAPDQ